MFRRLQTWGLAAASLAFILLNQRADAQSPEPAPKLLFSAAATNGNITFTWAAVSGKWGLFERQAMAKDWTQVPEEKYRTNGALVTATLPLPAQSAMYRVTRTFVMHPPAPPSFPPLPPPPTNRPPARIPARP